MPNHPADKQFNDLEIRISLRQDEGYLVEIILDSGQEFQGHLSADILPWISSGDPVVDGQRLFNTLLADVALRSAWDQARGQSVHRRIRLHIDTDAPELHALPWEFVCEGNTMLSANASTPFSRYLSVSEPWGDVVKERPIRVLVVISNPKDLESEYSLPSLNVEIEKDILKQAFSPLEEQVLLDFLPPPVTLESIEEAFQRDVGPGAPGYHVLHYVGHGAFSERQHQAEALLYLQDEEGNTDRVSDAAFSAMLNRQSPQARPRLIFLAACQSATRLQTDVLVGLAPRLVTAGVPAVVAMREHVAIETARRLSLVFYRRLAEHGVVDCALNAARSLLLTAGRPDAAAPVLFMRLQSGQLWKVSEIQDTDRPSRQSKLGCAIQPSHLFICYKRGIDPDQELASYLFKNLAVHGHDVFIDGSLRTGAAWLKEIDRQIKSSDFLIVLLSEASADSEMVQAEVRRAYDYRRIQGHPHILPVRIAYEGLLPYTIDAFLDPLQYVVWQHNTDNERIVQEILAAIEGYLPDQTPVQIQSTTGIVTVSEDGRVVADAGALHPPLPEFDPRFLEELEAPGGAVKLNDRFYVERDADAHLRREVVKPGTTTTIRAPRQTGKSSLFVRGVHHARQNGAQVVALSMQRVAQDYLETPNDFMRYLAEFIVRKLRLDMREVKKLWGGALGPQDKLTYLMEDYVLPESDAPIVLAIDEADRLLHDTAFYKDFFALIRSWHENRAIDNQWNKVNIVMVISTEPYLLIADVNQSPFNVGLRLYLKDFDEYQVRDLNHHHGSPVSAGDFPQLMTLLNGHPYLTRKALYTLVIEHQSWADFVSVASTDHGPFGDHLRRYHWLLHDEPNLSETLKEIIRHGRCADETQFFRLLRAGLVKGSEKGCACRCDLYRMYFEDKL